MANETEKDTQESGNLKDPQQSDVPRPNDGNQDLSKKAPGQDLDRKDREGSEDIEKRRAS